MPREVILFRTAEERHLKSWPTISRTSERTRLSHQSRIPILWTQWNTKPRGRPYDEETLKLRLLNRWARDTWLNLLVRWLIRVWNKNWEIQSIQVKSPNFALGFMQENWDLWQIGHSNWLLGARLGKWKWNQQYLVYGLWKRPLSLKGAFSPSSRPVIWMGKWSLIKPKI